MNLIIFVVIQPSSQPNFKPFLSQTPSPSLPPKFFFYYSCFIMLCQFLLLQTQFYIYTHIYTHIHIYICVYIYIFLLLYYLPPWSISRDWIQFPMLYSRTSLLNHSKCNSLHLLTPNSPPIPPLPLPLGNQKSVLQACESISVS